MKYYIFAYDTKSCIDYRIQNSSIKTKLILYYPDVFYLSFCKDLIKKKAKSMRRIRKYRSLPNIYSRE